MKIISKLDQTVDQFEKASHINFIPEDVFHKMPARSDTCTNDKIFLFLVQWIFWVKKFAFKMIDLLLQEYFFFWSNSSNSQIFKLDWFQNVEIQVKLIIEVLPEENFPCKLFTFTIN